MSSGVAVQVKGFASPFQFVMYLLVESISRRTDLKVPRLIACLVMTPNQISTWLSQELPVGVRWTVTLGVLRELFVDIVARVGGQVVEYHVNLAVFVRRDDLIHELDELFGASTRVVATDDFPGCRVQRGE
jgi:hypothetical protein